MPLPPDAKLTMDGFVQLPQLRTAIQARVPDGRPAEVDMVAWMGRTALELMGQGGLGYSFDPLVADAADEYGSALKDLMYVCLLLQRCISTHADSP